MSQCLGVPVFHAVSPVFTVPSVLRVSQCYGVISVPVFPVSRCAYSNVPVFPVIQALQYSVVPVPECYNVASVTVSHSVPSITVFPALQCYCVPSVPNIPLLQCSQCFQCLGVPVFPAVSPFFSVPSVPLFPVSQCSQRYSAPNVTVFSVTTFPESQCPVVLQCSQCSRCASVPCSIPSVQCSHCSQCPSILHVPVLSVSKYFLCPAFPVSQ